MNNYILLFICILIVVGILLTYFVGIHKELFVNVSSSTSNILRFNQKSPTTTDITNMKNNRYKSEKITFRSSGGKTNIVGTKDNGKCNCNGCNIYTYKISNIGDIVNSVTSGNNVLRYVNKSKTNLQKLLNPNLVITNIEIIRPIDGQGNNAIPNCSIRASNGDTIKNCYLDSDKNEFYFETNRPCGCYSNNVGDILRLVGEPYTKYALTVTVEGYIKPSGSQ